MDANGREFVSVYFGCFAVKSPLKKPPGEGTGPTRHADLRGNLVGRVPPRGEPDVFQQAGQEESCPHPLRPGPSPGLDLLYSRAAFILRRNQRANEESGVSRAMIECDELIGLVVRDRWRLFG